MKLSKYAALVRREGLCSVFRVHNDGVWLGCKGAIYRAGELPEFSGREQTRAILSLDDKQMDKVYLREYDCEETRDVIGYNLRDYDPGEQATKPVAMVAAVKGIYASALRTNDGELIFYDDNYLAPLSDVLKDSDYLEMTVRRLPSGTRYIAVKDGFSILAVILPLQIISEKFLAELQEFEALCTEQLFRQRARAEAGEAAEADELPDENDDQTSMEGMNDGTGESD